LNLINVASLLHAQHSVAVSRCERCHKVYAWHLLRVLECHEHRIKHSATDKLLK